MSAIETCRTSALGGHVERCEDCAHQRIAYNSCRNRHCPKCQGAASGQWLAEREAEPLPVPYYHVVFTLPAAIGAIVAVAAGAAIHQTHFDVPHDLPHGDYRLEVIANGIASESVEVHVHRGYDRDDHMRHDHDEEVFELEHEDSKYKDKDAKEAKEKEKDVKEAKEKDAKEMKEKDVKEFKEKDGKEAEHKSCKEKEHKEYEQKGWKEKDHAEQACQPSGQEPREYGELLQKIEHIAERLERIERDAERRPFIRREERPDVGVQSMRRHDAESRRDDERRHDEEPRRRDENRRGEERRTEPPRPEPPARSVQPPAPTSPRKRTPPKGPRG